MDFSNSVLRHHSEYDGIPLWGNRGGCPSAMMEGGGWAFGHWTVNCSLLWCWIMIIGFVRGLGLVGPHNPLPYSVHIIVSWKRYLLYEEGLTVIQHYGTIVHLRGSMDGKGSSGKNQECEESQYAIILSAKICTCDIKYLLIENSGETMLLFSALL